MARTRSQFLQPIQQLLKLVKPRLLRVFILLVLFLGTAILLPAVSEADPFGRAQTNPSPQNLEQQGRTLYETEQFPEAIKLWQQAIAASKTSGNQLQQAIILSNLSLAYQQLGQWDKASEAITQSLALIQSSTLKPQTSALLAQALDVQGRLQLARGQAEAALASWRRSANLYTQLGDRPELVQNQINQAQALQRLGLYRQAEKILAAANQTLQQKPNSLLKAAGLRSLGNVLRVTGDVQESQRVLQQSLTIATALNSPPAISATLLSLGNTVRAQQDSRSALQFYQQSATIATSLTTRIRAQLNQLSLLLENKQFKPAQELAIQIQAQLDRLPPSQSTVYAQINLAQSLMKLATAKVTSSATQSAAKLLNTAIQQSHNLGALRAEAYALGTLGELYEQNRQLPEAQTLTRKALLLSQAIDAPDITYQWQWQLGRLLKTQWESEARSQTVYDRAIDTYSEAIKTLQSLRSDLVAMNPDVQFSFRDRVEPVYREYVGLLLQPTSNSKEVKQDSLKKARGAIESLQLAELDNFFREACLQPTREIDQVVDQNQTAAAFYPIILPNRVEVILKLPQQKELRHYTTTIAQPDVESVLNQLRQNLVQPDPAFVEDAKLLSRKVYQWLIQPALADLTQNNVKTLVFVLDGALRDIPVAALYDGQRYLIEQYSVALTPGLQLVNPKALQPRSLKALVAGVSESRPPNFSELPNVPLELKQIQSEVSGRVLLNQQFTEQAFETQINSQSFPVVHLATHGQFGSTIEKTFILAWDKVIQVNELSELLRARDERRPDAIELLVLSACQTADGDNRAALGIAGIAVRAGARSTIASLWSIGDESTALLMSQFYRELIDKQLPKAEALRQAQLFLLKHPNPNYQRPLAWAPYVLIGNWL